MLFELFYEYPKRFISGAVILVVIVLALVWWNLIWQNPQRVFDGMLANNLSTTSVTKHAGATRGEQGIDQYIRLQMGSTNASTWLVTIKQAGSSVTTESIGTPHGGFVRYVDISAGNQKPGSNPLDFSSILNVWARSDPKDKTTSLNQLFSQSLLDVSTAPLPPIGNLPGEKRQDILDYIKTQNVFKPDYKSVKREKLAGQAVYTYKVAVKLGPFVRMMQAFARDMGDKSLETVDANQYSTAKPIDLNIFVNRATHRMVKITQPSSGFEQTYNNWGLNTPTTIPTNSIPLTELQARFSKLK